MSELKRDIGDGLTVEWSDASKRFVFKDGDDFLFWLTEEQFKNLDGFHSYVQTELASRQRLGPLPALKPITTQLPPAPCGDGIGTWCD